MYNYLELDPTLLNLHSRGLEFDCLMLMQKCIRKMLGLRIDFRCNKSVYQRYVQYKRLGRPRSYEKFKELFYFAAAVCSNTKKNELTRVGNLKAELLNEFVDLFKSWSNMVCTGDFALGRQVNNLFPETRSGECFTPRCYIYMGK